jgi:hypothetical protein
MKASIGGDSLSAVKVGAGAGTVKRRQASSGGKQDMTIWEIARS